MTMLLRSGSSPLDSRRSGECSCDYAPETRNHRTLTGNFSSDFTSVRPTAKKTRQG